MSAKDRKLNKAKKRAGLSKKWWRRFESESAYKRALDKFNKEHNEK